MSRKQQSRKTGSKQTPPKGENLQLQQKSEGFLDVTHASQRSYKFEPVKLVKQLNLEMFKLYPCNIARTHNHKQCVHFHNAKDRKRYGQFYSRNMCAYVERNERCPEGDKCMMAHSRVEMLYRHDSYKKLFCSHFPNSVSDCLYGDYCSFAHSEEESQSVLIHNYAEDEDFYMFYYKTEFCPFNLTEHDKAQCVYAHNWQDYRRSPPVYSYEPIACYNWKLKDFIVDYQSGCQNGVACNMCHGWKEQQYHPSHYRTIKCEEMHCRRGSCPNYHSENERRLIENEILSKCFKFVPKNRMVEGVFKSCDKKTFKPRTDHKARTVMDPRSTRGLQNDYRTRSIIGKMVSQATTEPGDNWIGKQMIESEEEDYDEVVSSQLQKLNLDQ